MGYSCKYRRIERKTVAPWKSKHPVTVEIIRRVGAKRGTDWGALIRKAEQQHASCIESR